MVIYNDYRSSTRSKKPPVTAGDVVGAVSVIAVLAWMFWTALSWAEPLETGPVTLVQVIKDQFSFVVDLLHRIW